MTTSSYIHRLGLHAITSWDPFPQILSLAYRFTSVRRWTDRITIVVLGLFLISFFWFYSLFILFLDHTRVSQLFSKETKKGAYKFSRSNTDITSEGLKKKKKKKRTLPGLRKLSYASVFMLHDSREKRPRHSASENNSFVFCCSWWSGSCWDF